jgi:hypothetical protein
VSNCWNGKGAKLDVGARNGFDRVYGKGVPSLVSEKFQLLILDENRSAMFTIRYK